MKTDMEQVMAESNQDTLPFTMQELNISLSSLKTGKAAGLDGITAEMVPHFGERTKEWLRKLTNKCATTYRIPRIWRQARVVALIKLGKDPVSQKLQINITVVYHI